MSSWAEEALQSFVLLTAEARERLRGNKINEKKQQIASLASAVVSDPHSNVRLHQLGLQLPPPPPAFFTCPCAFQMKHLKELRGMLMERDPCVAVTIRKLVMVSLMEIFKDITPTYRIRPLTAAEMAVKVISPAHAWCGRPPSDSVLTSNVAADAPEGEEADPAAPPVRGGAPQPVQVLPGGPGADHQRLVTRTTHGDDGAAAD